MPTWSLRLPFGVGRKPLWAPEQMPWTRADWLGLGLVAVGVWTLWCSLAAKAEDRIRTLKTVEGYAIAVYDQLVWNFAFNGAWRQTIHFGYDDTWNWSGHLALWIFPIAGLYRLFPGPTTLVWAQTAAVALGGIPMYFLARRVFGARPAGVAAGLGYLCWPAVWAVALADYQDIVLGVPFLIAAYAASQSGRGVATAFFALLTCAAREEWLFLLPFIALAAPGGFREKVRQGLILALALVPYVAFLVQVRVSGNAQMHHDTPLLQQLNQFARWPPPFTRNYVDMRWFYVHFLEPFGWVGVFSPITALPTAMSWFMHACSPPEGGVETRWLGHIHHMAPISAMLAVGATLGAARLWSWISWLWGAAPLLPAPRGGALVRRFGGVALAASVLGGIAWGALDTERVLPWLKVTLHATPQGTAKRAPEWDLLEQYVPPGATIATDTDASLMVSSRAVSYTYDESLAEKSKNKNLAAVEFVLVRRTDTEWLKRVQAWRGMQKLGETPTYELYGVK